MEVKIRDLDKFANDSSLCQNCEYFDTDYGEKPCRDCFIEVDEPSEYVKKRR